MKPMQPMERVAMPMVVALALSTLAGENPAGRRPATAGAAAPAGTMTAGPPSGTRGWDLSDLEMTGRPPHLAGIDSSPGRRPRWSLIEGLLATGPRSGW